MSRQRKVVMTPVGHGSFEYQVSKCSYQDTQFETIQTIAVVFFGYFHFPAHSAFAPVGLHITFYV